MMYSNALPCIISLMPLYKTNQPQVHAENFQHETISLLPSPFTDSFYSIVFPLFHFYMTLPNLKSSCVSWKIRDVYVIAFLDKE